MFRSLQMYFDDVEKRSISEHGQPFVVFFPNDESPCIYRVLEIFMSFISS